MNVVPKTPKKTLLDDSDSDHDAEKFHFYKSVGIGIGFRTPILFTNFKSLRDTSSYLST